MTSTDFTDAVKWNSDGLAPAIAQEVGSGRILMMAWMNRDALRETASRGIAVYWSRSRQALWRKGESSGHTQTVHKIQLDCDADAIILAVEQQGGIACHTGRHSCFYRTLEDGEWRETEAVIKHPNEIYS